MNAKKDMYVVTCKHQMHTKINEFINLHVILFLSDINECEKGKCPDKSDCENTEGSYNCDRRKARWKIAIIGMFVCSLILENE